MCTNCKQNKLNPTFEAILHKEYEEELYPELEWENYGTPSKKYTGASSNRSYGATSAPSRGYIKPGPKYSKPTVSYNQPQTETKLVQNAIANGERNENTLTDLVFFKRHPELGGQPLSSSQANFATLSKEWISARDGIVRPALLAPSAPVSTKPSPVPGTGTGKINLQSILNALAKKRYIVYTKPYQLNIVGIRANNPQPNSFDDNINLFYKDNAGNWQFKSNAATTDPGLFTLNNPDVYNTKGTGTAILIPGQYVNSYKIGLHRGEYTALVQQGGPVRIMRDFNKDNRLDFKTGREEPPGYYGINIHRASINGTTITVDKYSAGCQVFANINDFNLFIQLCEQHKRLHGDSFTYTLLEESDL